jgi:hypothetical protein
MMPRLPKKVEPFLCDMDYHLNFFTVNRAPCIFKQVSKIFTTPLDRFTNLIINFFKYPFRDDRITI